MFTRERAMPASEEMRLTWSTVARSVNRPYPVTIPMVLLVSLVPFYLFIAGRARAGTAYAPELPLDRLFPLAADWVLVYGALYGFLIVLPVFVIQQPELIRRTVWAYLTVWGVAYACFLLYPTVAPRTDTVPGDGFAVWGLRFLYEADPPYNCFPSLHVAHSFVSALACLRVHRTLGAIAIASAILVGISTVFTKQHYVADVVGGVLLAMIAYVIFLHRYSRARIPDLEHRVAPFLALVVAGMVGLGFGCFWVAYKLNVQLWSRLI